MTESMDSFESFSDEIQRAIADLGWQEPMPVQTRVIPAMREARDLIVQAVTGSGKTGAFGLPIIEKIETQRREIQALVLTPTRELAAQVAREIAAMSKYLGLETLTIYGGVAYGPQLEALEQGVHVVVGTPGRILDHLNSRRMDLRKVKVLIFDEADELLSLGFWPDMREIQEFLPRDRQSGLFSATIPERVRSLARFFLRDPEFISLVDEQKRSPDEIEHYHYIVSASEKDAVLLRILEYEDPESAIIFCNTRDDVRYVSAYLRRHNHDADMIQGEMSQAAREEVMKRIKAGELRFLVATDVAARGIDISDLSHVISYSAPESPEVYLHRTGRTGRAGKTGTAISLISGLDIGRFGNLQAVNRMTIPEREIPTAAELTARIVQRAQVKIEHDLRELGERERRLREDRALPVVEFLASTQEGRRDLAGILYQYLHGTPTIGEPKKEPTPPPVTPRPAAGDAPRPRRRRRRRTSGGGS